MTKRFTPNAGAYTQRLAEVQQAIAIKRRALAALEAEERSLKGWLMPFYDEGKTEVDAGGVKMKVNFSVHERQYLNQELAKAIITKAGKKVPMSTTQVVSFHVTKRKEKK